MLEPVYGIRCRLVAPVSMVDMPVTLLTFSDTPDWTLGSVERVMGPRDLKAAADLTQDALDPRVAQ